MQTFLGCRGEAKILDAVRRCCASLYAFQSVEYRRQNGQPVVTGMGVVVQEMAEAEAAGVMFTRDPVSGNPERIVITANYGLGEVRRRWEPSYTVRRSLGYLRCVGLLIKLRKCPPAGLETTTQQQLCQNSSPI